jgi:hypothetical protein
MFTVLILVRVLFLACMTFVIGYIFGNFSRRKNLVIVSKIASILVIVLFMFSNVMFIRSGGRNWTNSSLWHFEAGHSDSCRIR